MLAEKGKALLNLATWLSALLAAVAIGFLVQRGQSPFSPRIPDQVASEIVDTTEALRRLKELYPGSDEKTLFVFSDFLCPFCGAYAEDLSSSAPTSEAVKRVNLVPFPDETLHPGANDLARASICLRDFGALWPDFTDLYELGRGFHPAVEMIGRLQISADRLSECISSEGTSERLDSILAIARQLGVSRTPTTVLGDSFFVGRMGRPQIRRLFRR